MTDNDLSALSRDRITLYNHEPRDCEGIIVLKSTGKVYVNQTGGISCNQSSAEGEWIPTPIPYTIQRRTCCRYFAASSNSDQFEMDIINREFAEAGIPFKAVSGEEAWIEGFYKDQPAIVTWWNCD